MGSDPVFIAAVTPSCQQVSQPMLLRDLSVLNLKISPCPDALTILKDSAIKISLQFYNFGYFGFYGFGCKENLNRAQSFAVKLKESTTWWRKWVSKLLPFSLLLCPPHTSCSDMKRSVTCYLIPRCQAIQGIKRRFNTLYADGCKYVWFEPYKGLITVHYNICNKKTSWACH